MSTDINAAKDVTLVKPQVKTIGAVSNTQSSMADKHGRVTLMLPSNASTGFSWRFDHAANQAGIKVVSHKYIAPTSELIGASGHEKWVFQLPKATINNEKHTKIKMVYGRPWNHNTDTTQIFTVHTSDKKAG